MGAFCLVLAGSALVSMLVPLTVDPKDVFFYGLIGFFAYLGFSFLFHRAKD